MQHKILRTHTVPSDPHTTHQPNATKPQRRVASLSTPLNISSGGRPWCAAPMGFFSFSWDVKQETGCGAFCDVTSHHGRLWTEQLNFSPHQAFLDFIVLFLFCGRRCSLSRHCDSVSYVIKLSWLGLLPLCCQHSRQLFSLDGRMGHNALLRYA